MKKINTSFRAMHKIIHGDRQLANEELQKRLFGDTLGRFMSCGALTGPWRSARGPTVWH